MYSEKASESLAILQFSITLIENTSTRRLTWVLNTDVTLQQR